MSSSNFIPRADEVFLVWEKTLLAYVQSKLSAWNIPQAPVNELQILCANFGNALATAENPVTRTKVTVQSKNDARKALESKTRLFLKAYVTFNPAVTDSDRDAMSLPIYKTTRTPVPVPTTLVEAEVLLPSPGVVEISFHDAKSGHRAKPAGVHGAEIGWAILDTPPKDWKELNHSTFDTSSPQRLTFEGTDRGKTLYFALRWENTRGDKGPWSEIQSTIIP